MSDEELLKSTKAQILFVKNQEISELQKALKDEQAMKEHYKTVSISAQKELQDVHSFLDGLPNVLPQKKPEASWESYSVSARLLSWIANKLN